MKSPAIPHFPPGFLSFILKEDLDLDESNVILFM